MQTGLFIPAPGRTLQPHNGILAVVGGDIRSEGPNATLMIISPASAVAALQEPQAMVSTGPAARPLWHRVDSDYAGLSRMIDQQEYREIWSRWLFMQIGLLYDPLRIMSMHDGHRQSMYVVLKTIMALRSLRYNGLESIVETLARAAYSLDYSHAFMQQLPDYDAEFAELIFEQGQQVLSDRAKQLLKNFVRVEGGRLTYIDPWRIAF